MNKEYYIVVDDNRVGPLSFEQLGDRGLEPSTLVWTSGLADWTRADCIPELAPLLTMHTRVDESESAFGAYARVNEPAAPRYPDYGPNDGVRPSYGAPQSSVNWKTLSIVATVVGFLFSCIGGIIGIIAIVQASGAENAARYGDEYQAQSKWSTCRTLTIISFVLSGIGLIANIVWFRNLMNSGLFDLAGL